MPKKTFVCSCGSVHYVSTKKNGSIVHAESTAPAKPKKQKRKSLDEKNSVQAEEKQEIPKEVNEFFDWLDSRGNNEQ